ncbi:hypothetical protein LXL04_001819 [Taraxacum kok-saghyz]
MKLSLYFPKPPWMIAFLPPILTFAYGSFGNFTIFFIVITVFILVSSTFLFLPLSEHNVQAQEQDEHDLICSDRKSSNHVEDEAKVGFSDKSLPESYSENEIMGRFSSSSEEDSDFDCSDEESLIEIELPAGNYVRFKAEGEEDDVEPELCFKRLSPEISPESIHRWLEINEEDNFIEIDISMGSIK